LFLACPRNDERNQATALAVGKTPLVIVPVDHSAAKPKTASRRRFSAQQQSSVWTLPLLVPTVGTLALWSVVPTILILWFAFQGYNLLTPPKGFVGLRNFYFLLTDPGLPTVLSNTVVMVVAPMAATIALGTIIAVVFNEYFPGRSLARLFVIGPFFVMPIVSALVWKNLFMHPVYGLFAGIARAFGLPAIDWFSDFPLTSILIIIIWEWTPFAALILLTSLQSLDHDQVEAATMDGAGAVSLFRYIVVPHLGRPIAIVAMLESIFFLGIYAEISVTTVGGPGLATTNLPFYIYSRALLGFDIGGASAAGILAIVVANLVTILFVRTVAREI
jgi:sorbitol/mannitol transport system permease protein